MKNSLRTIVTRHRANYGGMAVRAFSQQATASSNPMQMFEEMSKNAMSKAQDAMKEPIEKATKEVTEKSTEKISAVVNAMILLSRSNLMSDEELDSKLGQLLPPQMVDVVKAQSKLLPADPYMDELKKISQRLDAIEKKVGAGK